MTQSVPGMLVILSGPTAVGKNTVGEHLMRTHPDLTRIVTATTRTPRAGEIDGEDYHFCTEEDFKAGLARNRFLEYAEVHGRYYGTPASGALQAIDSGMIALLIIDVDGAAQIRELEPDVLTIFLLPPSRNALEERIRGRGTEDEAAIVKRLERVDKELACAPNYHAQVINGELGACVRQVWRVIEAARAELATTEAAGKRTYRALRKRVYG